jgi:cytochrome P450
MAIYKLTSGPPNQCPDNSPLPVTHVSYAEISDDLVSMVRALHAEHGPIAALQDGSQRVVFLFSPEFNQQVLSDPNTFHARFFAIRGPKQSSQRRLTCGLLAMNGPQHRRNRRLVKEPFSLRTIATYGESINRLADEMLEGWQVGDQIDIADQMRRYMLRVTSTLLFGFDRPEQAYRIGDMLAHWVAMNHQLGTGALVPDAMFSDKYEELLAYANELEAEIMEMIRHCRNAQRPGRDVLSILVRAHDEAGGLSDEELVGQAAVLFGAAHMTTAHSLSWTLFLLAQHPSVMQQLWHGLQNESLGDDLKGPKGSMGGESSSLLDRVVKESMRVLPASAYSQRVNMEAVRLGPFNLPRGTGIVFTPLIVHHLASLYPDPEYFDPERWRKIRPSPYEYLPFGAGPRMCIGAPMAMAILRMTLPRILRRYRLTVIPNAEIEVQIESTMLAPVHGIPMRVDAPDGQFQSVAVKGNVHEMVALPKSNCSQDNPFIVNFPNQPGAA